MASARTNEYMEHQPEELERQIVDHVAAGGSLQRYCEVAELSYTKVRKWLRSEPERHRRYREAREVCREERRDHLEDTLAELATLDMSQITNADGTVMPVRDWPADLRRMCQQVQSTMTREGDVLLQAKFPDKLRAIELYGKAVGMWTENVHIKGEVDLGVVALAGTAKARARLAEKERKEDKLLEGVHEDTVD